MQYDDFTADPVATAFAGYEHVDLPLTHRARLAIAESRSGERRPAHRYRLEDFELTESEVDERCTGSSARYVR